MFIARIMSIERRRTANCCGKDGVANIRARKFKKVHCFVKRPQSGVLRPHRPPNGPPGFMSRNTAAILDAEPGSRDCAIRDRSTVPRMRTPS